MNLLKNSIESFRKAIITTRLIVTCSLRPVHELTVESIAEVKHLFRCINVIVTEVDISAVVHVVVSNDKMLYPIKKVMMVLRVK